MFSDYFAGTMLLISAKMCLRKHGATASEVPVYISHLWELFHQETEKQYCDTLDQLMKWSEAFLTYNMDNLDKKVCVHEVVAILI